MCYSLFFLIYLIITINRINSIGTEKTKYSSNNFSKINAADIQNKKTNLCFIFDINISHLITHHQWQILLQFQFSSSFRK